MSLKGSVRNLSFVYALLSVRQKYFILFVLSLLVITSLMEVSVVSSLYPIIYSILNGKDAGISAFSIYKAILFILASLVTRLSLTFSIERLSASVGNQVAVILYSSVLSQPFSYFQRYSRPQYLNLFSYVSSLVRNQLQPFLYIIQSIILSIAILIVTFYIGGLTSFVVFAFLGIIYSILTYSSSRISSSISRHNHTLSESLIKSQSESLSYIREILIHSEQSLFLDHLAKNDMKLRTNSYVLNVLTASPRYVIEAFTLCLILTLLLVSLNTQFKHNVAPGLGLCLISFQRLFPNLQQLYSSLTTLIGNSYVSQSIATFLVSINKQLHMPVSASHVESSAAITLYDVCYLHDKSNFKLLVPKLRLLSGNWYKVSGATGSGKSTLQDLILGLLKPTTGSISYYTPTSDFRPEYSYKTLLAHVPQSIFLFNDSISFNITLTHDSAAIDYHFLDFVIETCCLREFILQLPDRASHTIDDNSTNISGGQRQRIGIARALYRKPYFLFLDEATNALDKATESQILGNIKANFRQTMVFCITHSKSMDSALFDEFIYVSDGSISVNP